MWHVLKFDKIEDTKCSNVVQWQLSMLISLDVTIIMQHESMCCLYVEPSPVIFRLTVSKQRFNHIYTTVLLLVF